MSLRDLVNKFNNELSQESKVVAFDIEVDSNPIRVDFLDLAQISMESAMGEKDIEAQHKIFQSTMSEIKDATDLIHRAVHSSSLESANIFIDMFNEKYAVEDTTLPSITEFSAEAMSQYSQENAIVNFFKKIKQWFKNFFAKMKQQNKVRISLHKDLAHRLRSMSAKANSSLQKLQTTGANVATFNSYINEYFSIYGEVDLKKLVADKDLLELSEEVHLAGKRHLGFVDLHNEIYREALDVLRKEPETNPLFVLGKAYANLGTQKKLDSLTGENKSRLNKVRFLNKQTVGETQGVVTDIKVEIPLAPRIFDKDKKFLMKFDFQALFINRSQQKSNKDTLSVELKTVQELLQQADISLNEILNSIALLNEYWSKEAEIENLFEYILEKIAVLTGNTSTSAVAEDDEGNEYEIYIDNTKAWFNEWYEELFSKVVKLNDLTTGSVFSNIRIMSTILAAVYVLTEELEVQ